MLISEQLHNIIRTIQNQCTTGEQMDVLSYFMSDSRKITDFVFVDKGESDDTVRFFNSKVSKNDVVYTLPNPTVVGLDHEIYQPTLKAIKAPK
jgi:hypothetical protein